MAAGEASVSANFDKSLQLYQDIVDSSLPGVSPVLQRQVKEAVEGLVRATVLVSELGVFSSNEDLDELPTSSLKFLLLPVLLGCLTLRRTDLDRPHLLHLAAVYLRDFIRRCREYGLTQVHPPEDPSEPEEEEEEEEGPQRLRSAPPKRGMPTPEELQAMARQRQEKIQRYKERKDLSARLVELKKALDNPSRDEDVLRNYYITMIKKFIYESLEELESVVTEKKMLGEMAMLRLKGNAPSPEPRPQTRPLKPILITKDAFQKNVFGLGYPSLPSMTVEEFYDQRVREGWFPNPTKSRTCLQDQASMNPEAEKEAQDRQEQEEEEKEEKDDPEKLERERERDEWRDTHRRGWGNTYNRS